jgi:fimbrial isopeptide formation D2 family protein
MAAQAHAADNAVNYIQQYRAFAESGGNLLLQCYSVQVFENQNPFGRFQTTGGWRIFTTNNPPGDDVITALAYPNPGMPFNQFIGPITDATGKVSEYQLASGSNFRLGTVISIENTQRNEGSTRHPNWVNYSQRKVASVSRIGTQTAGGNVFELGGHEYDGTSSNLSEKNGARMVLNSLLVPAIRSGCGLEIPQVLGYKHVQLTTDVNGNGFINPGDTVTWTIDYINTSDVPSSNFQIKDELATGLTITGTGAQVVNHTATGGTTASKNNSYTGKGSNTNLLASGAYLGPNGRITVKIPTTIDAGTYGTLLNHPLANGSGITGSGVTTDTLDHTNTVSTSAGTITPPNGSYPQNPWQTPGLDPTGIQILSPSAADSTVSGTVIDWTRTGISRTAVTLTDIGTGSSRTVMTNSFGIFRFDNVETGHFHVISAQHPRYQFRVPSFSFTVNENIVGLTFVAGAGPAPRGADESVNGAR